MAKKVKGPLLGTDGDDLLEGGNGKDTINAGLGNDTVNGGNGKDQLFGDLGDDTLLGGNSNDNLDGGEGNDVLDGGMSNDLLEGGAGTDLLMGGMGHDTLTGGADADTFVFDSNFYKGGADIVSDFDAAGLDVLEFRDMLDGFDPLASVITDYVRFTEVNGDTVVSVDTNGAAGGAQFRNVVTLENATGLDEATLLAAGNIVVT